MTQFVSNNVSSGSIIYASDHNEMGSRIAAVVNGGLDDTNISAVSGTKISAGTLPGTALDAATAGGWLTPSTTFTYNANNGNKEFVLTPSADPTGFLSPGMRFKLTRHTVPPTQCMAFASASSQYAKSATNTPTGMAWTTAFTTEAWVYVTSYTIGVIVGRSDTTSAVNGWQMYLDGSGRINVNYLSSSASTNFQSYQSVPRNRWVHIAATATVATRSCAIYINGVSVPGQLTQSSATSLTQNGFLAIGANNIGGTPGQFFNGYISEARVWSVAQTQAQIQANMAINLTGSETNLVALFKGNGNFNDVTTNANNLTATNGAIATQAANPFNATEYAIITKVASGAVTVFCGTDYTIPNDTLDSPAYSTEKAPYGFPASKGKWRVDFRDRGNATQSSPTSGTWYNPNSDQISIPTGEWTYGYNVNLYAARTSAGTASAYATLSTANNSEVDTELTARVYTNVSASTTTAVEIMATVTRSKPLTVTSQTTYYLNAKVDSTSHLLVNFEGGQSDTIIYAESAYI